MRLYSNAMYLQQCIYSILQATSSSPLCSTTYVKLRQELALYQETHPLVKFLFYIFHGPVFYWEQFDEEEEADEAQHTTHTDPPTEGLYAPSAHIEHTGTSKLYSFNFLAPTELGV